METASSRALAAFGATGALDKMVKLPFGEMPAGVALNIAVFDVLTHAADIASATGQTIEDTALVETALEVGHQMIGPDLRAPGIFDPSSRRLWGQHPSCASSHLPDARSQLSGLSIGPASDIMASTRA